MIDPFCGCGVLPLDMTVFIRYVLLVTFARNGPRG
jgi:hypothetical protein